MHVNCVVACRNASGVPDFFACAVEVTQAEHDEGDHYDRAQERAAEAGFAKPLPGTGADRLRVWKRLEFTVQHHRAVLARRPAGFHLAAS